MTLEDEDLLEVKQDSYNSLFTIVLKGNYEEEDELILLNFFIVHYKVF